MGGLCHSQYANHSHTELLSSHSHTTIFLPTQRMQENMLGSQFKTDLVFFLTLYIKIITLTHL